MGHKAFDLFISEWWVDMLSSFQNIANHVKIGHHDHIATLGIIWLI
jgi:hypothetical protein